MPAEKSAPCLGIEPATSHNVIGPQTTKLGGHPAVLRCGYQLLGLPAVFTMHSLRHSRATLGFLNGDLPEVIRLEGRWAEHGVVSSGCHLVVDVAEGAY